MEFNGSLYPTQLEADALASLVSASQLQPQTPTLDLLSEVLQFCQRPDVCNFLFAEEPIHLSHFANPHLAKTAVSGSIVATRIEDNPAHVLSDHLTGIFLLAPVFSSHDLNFGFGVHEHVYTPGYTWRMSETRVAGRCNSRFVRDDSIGAMVVVLDIPEIDMLQVDYTRLIKTTGQTHSIARFRRRMFRSTLASGRLDVLAVIPALEMLQTSYEARDCPVCNGPHQQCNCTIRASKPRHPLDIESFHDNMERRLGTFQGVSNIAMFQRGRRAQTTSLGCRLTIEGGVDEALIERLRRWSIGSSPKSQDPRHSLLVYGNQGERNEEMLGITGTSMSDPLLEDVGFGDELEADLWFMEDEPNAVDDSLENRIGWTDTGISTAPMDVTVNPAAEVSVPEIIEVLPTAKDPSEVTVPETVAIESATKEKSLPRGQPEPSRSSGDAAVSTTGAKNEREEGDADLVKHLKAELRRERNRASAQRSNLRKKAETDAKKLEIKTNREKACLLRERELMLRQENIRLRKMLTGDTDGGGT